MSDSHLLQTIPAFPVLSIEEAVEFYTEILGFSCTFKEDSFAMLTRSEIELHLWLANDRSWFRRSFLLFLKPIISGAESFITGTHSCRIRVNGIDDLYEEFAAKDVLHGTQNTIEVKEWGEKDFHILDLYGNLITFFEKI